MNQIMLHKFCLLETMIIHHTITQGLKLITTQRSGLYLLSVLLLHIQTSCNAFLNLVEGHPFLPVDENMDERADNENWDHEQ